MVVSNAEYRLPGWKGKRGLEQSSDSNSPSLGTAQCQPHHEHDVGHVNARPIWGLKIGGQQLQHRDPKDQMSEEKPMRALAVLRGRSSSGGLRRECDEVAQLGVVLTASEHEATAQCVCRCQQ